MRVNILVTAAGGTCFGTRSNAMSPCLLIRTSYQIREFQKIVREGPSIRKIFLWASKDLYKITQGPLKGFHQDLHLLTSSHKDLYKTLVKISTLANICKLILKRLSAELIRSLCQELCEAATMRTAPQRERSDTHKVPRRLCERMVDFDKTCAHHETWTLKKSKTTF